MCVLRGEKRCMRLLGRDDAAMRGVLPMRRALHTEASAAPATSEATIVICPTTAARMLAALRQVWTEFLLAADEGIPELPVEVIWSAADRAGLARLVSYDPALHFEKQAIDTAKRRLQTLAELIAAADRERKFWERLLVDLQPCPACAGTGLRWLAKDKEERQENCPVCDGRATARKGDHHGPA